MVISQPPGNNFPYYYRASPTPPQLLWMLPETLPFYTCNYNIRVTHRNGAIKHIYTNQIHGGIISRLFLFILSLHAQFFIQRLKYYQNLSVWRFEHVGTYIHLSVVFPPNASRTALFVTQPILQNIPTFDINHQQTQGSDQTGNDKTIMQTTRPRITWKVLPNTQVAIFKERSDQVWKDLDCELFYSEPKRHNY